jgi:hypothetical protein
MAKAETATRHRGEAHTPDDGKWLLEAALSKVSALRPQGCACRANAMSALGH